MEGLEDALHQLLNDPAQLAELASLASSLGLSPPAAPAAAPTSESPPAPPELERQIQEPAAPAEHTFAPQRPSVPAPPQHSRPPARQEKLLSALKPFLKPSRQEKLDRALRLAQLSDLAGAVLRHSGSKP